MYFHGAEDGEPGFKLRVERWDKKLSPPPRVQASSTTRESRQIPAACTTSVSNGLKERACFVAEFLAAQSRSIGGPQSPRGQQLYSRVVSNKTADTRLKFMETAIYDMTAAQFGAPYKDPKLTDHVGSGVMMLKCCREFEDVEE